MKRIPVFVFSLIFLVACSTLGTSPAASQVTPTVAGPGLYATMDNVLKEATTGHLAYTAPSQARMGEALNFQLLLSPIKSAQELSNQIIDDTQGVVTAEIKITPYMKAELIAADPDAFIIQALHDNPVQVILSDETTEWSWTVTPKKSGNQALVLSVYRLVQFDGSDSWRLVQTYQSNVRVNVTAFQWIESVDWKWVVGILITVLSMPIVKNLFDKRQAKRGKK